MKEKKRMGGRERERERHKLHTSLGVHQVELVVQAGEHLGDGRGVGDHAAGALHLGQVAAGDNRGGLVVDAALEAGRAPVDELDGALGLNCCDGG